MAGDSRTILFDAGPESKSIARNIKALKIDAKTIERIVLSVSINNPQFFPKRVFDKFPHP